MKALHLLWIIPSVIITEVLATLHIMHGGEKSDKHERRRYERQQKKRK